MRSCYTTVLWQIEQVSKQDHWAPEKQICAINSATFGLKFDYWTRASSNLIICRAKFLHSTAIRRMLSLCGYTSTIRQGSDECCRFLAILPMYPKNCYITMYAIFAYMDCQGGMMPEHFFKSETREKMNFGLQFALVQQSVWVNKHKTS